LTTPTAVAALVALVLLGVFGLIGFAWRTWLQHPRTGSTGVRGISGRIGSAEWVAGLGLAIALVVAVVGPVLQLRGVITPVSVLHAGWIQIAALELQVRRVEEPYLLGKHGDAYRGYRPASAGSSPGWG
jgi:nicotinamide riboside transporter PnuC